MLVLVLYLIPSQKDDAGGAIGYEGLKLMKTIATNAISLQLVGYRPNILKML